VEEAFEEGQGPHKAVESVVMIGGQDNEEYYLL
jgi:hypothetical protein